MEFELPEPGESLSVHLPAIVCGEPVEREYVHSFDYGESCTVHLPRLSEAETSTALLAPNPLADVPLDDILFFLDRVGREWSDPENKWRRLASQLGPLVTTLNRDNVGNDLRYMANCLQYPVLYGMLETELGDPNVMESWQTRKVTRVRAWPKGIVAHILVGNVPMAAFLSLVRSIITKNVTVAKLPSRDVATALCLAHCMREVDPEHPVVRSLTVGYWRPESAVQALVLERADVVMVWGRTESIESVRAQTGPGTEVVEFGSKRSMAIVTETDDWHRLGMWLAYDVANYEQEACFSVKEVFVVGDPAPLVEAVVSWLERLSVVMPPTERHVDSDAAVHRARLVETALECKVEGSRGAEWTIIVLPRGQAPTDAHPLGRTLYVHQVDSLDDVLPFVDSDVQTVTLEPFELSETFGVRLGAAGVDRIVRFGRAGRSWPEGFVHDGFYPLQRLVRWTSIESPIDWFYRIPNFDRQLPGDEFRRHSEYATGERAFHDRGVRLDND